MTATVIVIGGGIVGSSAAYELARRGADVTLVDREDEGYATQAGAGIVSAVSARHRSEEWESLAFPSVEHYPRLVERLAEDGVDRVGYERTEGLVVASTDEEARALAGLHEALLAQGDVGAARFGTLSMLAPAEARRAFPPLAEPAAALHMSAGARVDGRVVRAALRAAFERRGGTIVAGTGRVLLERSRAAGVEVDGRRAPADAVICCAGAWRPIADGPLPALPVYPQRGQIAHLRVPGGGTGAWPFVVGYHSHYLLPFEDRVVAGATREHDAGFDHRLTAGGVREVLSEALRIAPGLDAATLSEIRVGFRPFSPDAIPLIGRFVVDGLYVATGLGPSGLTAGPFTGALVAALALGEPAPIDIRPFDPSRAMPAHEVP